MAAFGLMIEILLAIWLMPNVNGGPMNCILCSDTSVHTSVSRFVSTAVTKVVPAPNRKSPAVLVGVAAQSVNDSCALKRISSGSCTPGDVSLSQPKASTCLSLSDTSTCFATCGALVAPATPVINAARVLGVVASQ